VKEWLWLTVNNMSERQNTVVCALDPASPRISAYDIHEWLFTELRVSEHEILLKQIDVIKRYVYIKMTDSVKVQSLIDKTGGLAEFKHQKGEISQVNIIEADRGRKRVRVANLPPEVPNETIRAVLAQ
jgi:hypothetical protein